MIGIKKQSEEVLFMNVTIDPVLISKMPGCSGQQKLVTVLEFFLNLCSDSFATTGRAIAWLLNF